jgi:hypothetical protein
MPIPHSAKMKMVVAQFMLDDLNKCFYAKVVKLLSVEFQAVCRQQIAPTGSTKP